jgi:archaeosortase A (PGF-CTERM-specific)
MFQARNETDDKNKRGEILISLTRAVSVSGIVYFMFVDIVFLNTWLISLVTGQVIWLLEKIGYPVVAIAWNRLAVNGHIVEIILACTGIESMALFFGLVLSAKKSMGSQKFKAFLISVPVIYILNLIRVSFTASAFGFAWFGSPEESFHIAEHMITKVGSTLALIGISYMVLKILPEVAELIDGLVMIMKTDLKKLTASKL